jgi:hypothetical protein
MRFFGLSITKLPDWYTGTGLAFLSFYSSLFRWLFGVPDSRVHEQLSSTQCGSEMWDSARVLHLASCFEGNSRNWQRIVSSWPWNGERCSMHTLPLATLLANYPIRTCNCFGGNTPMCGWLFLFVHLFEGETVMTFCTWFLMYQQCLSKLWI